MKQQQISTVASSRERAGGVTAQLAHFASSHSFDLSGETKRMITNGFVDCTAAMIAGQREPAVEVLLSELQLGIDVKGAASLFLDKTKRCTVEDAALINATAAHALDYDDMALTGHPSAVLVPALLAEGERLQASGLRLLRAYYVGYVVWKALLDCQTGRLHDRGYHPTAVLGTIAVAAAVANLRGGDAELARQALAIAASTASGLTANFGTMFKSYQVGRAAAGGIHAVRLARAGLNGADNLLEADGGFLATLSRDGNFRRELIDGSLDDTRVELEFKKYPVCFAAHRTIEAALRLGVENAAGIASIEIRLPRTHAKLLRHHSPGNDIEAKFSAEFAVAAIFLRGRLGLAELSVPFIRSEPVRDLIVRTTIVEHDGSGDLGARVIVKLSNGKIRDSMPVATVSKAIALQQKFHDCCLHGGWAEPERLFEHLSSLADVPDVRLLAQ